MLTLIMTLCAVHLVTSLNDPAATPSTHEQTGPTRVAPILPHFDHLPTHWTHCCHSASPLLLISTIVQENHATGPENLVLLDAACDAMQDCWPKCPSALFCARTTENTCNSPHCTQMTHKNRVPFIMPFQQFAQQQPIMNVFNNRPLLVVMISHCNSVQWPIDQLMLCSPSLLFTNIFLDVREGPHFPHVCLALAVDGSCNIIWYLSPVIHSLSTAAAN